MGAKMPLGNGIFLRQSKNNLHEIDMNLKYYLVLVKKKMRTFTCFHAYFSITNLLKIFIQDLNSIQWKKEFVSGEMFCWYSFSKAFRSVNKKKDFTDKNLKP